MRHISLQTLVGLLLAASLLAGTASASDGVFGHRRSRQPAWHGQNYHAAWGAPVALVVPPGADTSTHWGWGVGSTQITPIRPQFGRSYPGPASYGGWPVFSPTPAWPANTSQFGVYYIRGPW
jgi:hypothetical protein